MGILDNPAILGVIAFFGIFTTAYWYGFITGHLVTKKIKFIKENSWVVMLIAGLFFLLIYLNIINVGAIIETGTQIAAATGEVV